MSGDLDGAVLDGARLEAVRATGLLDTPAEEAFDELARLAATLLDAPFAFVTLVDDTRSFWKSAIGVASSDPADRQHPVRESFCQYVIASRTPLVVDDAAADPLTCENPSIELRHVAAWAGFPVFGPAGDALGSFCVVDTVVRKWTARDVEVLHILSRAATREIALRALARQAKEAAERSAALARTLQDSLLPPTLPQIAGLDVAARYRPAGRGIDVVGDFYDVFCANDGTWLLVMGDVCGKGVAAAKVATLARYTLRATAMHSAEPCEMLEQLNQTLLRQSPAPGLFVTVVVVAVHSTPTGARLRLCSAGHTPPLVLRADGTVHVVKCAGTLLGVFDEVSLAAVDVDLAFEESLVLTTDGVQDARAGGQMLGERGLARAVAQAHGADADTLAAHIEQTVASFAAGLLPDDAAILVMRVPAR